MMISQEVDLVAGDFNGSAWRCRSRDNLSTVDEGFTDCLAHATGPHTVVGTRIRSELFLHPSESTRPETECAELSA